MRTDLIGGLLAVAAHNLARGHESPRDLRVGTRLPAAGAADRGRSAGGPLRGRPPLADHRAAPDRRGPDRQPRRGRMAQRSEARRLLRRQGPDRAPLRRPRGRGRSRAGHPPVPAPGAGGGRPPGRNRGRAGSASCTLRCWLGSTPAAASPSSSMSSRCSPPRSPARSSTRTSRPIPPSPRTSPFSPTALRAPSGSAPR